jgi:hypothetical protein
VPHIVVTAIGRYLHAFACTRGRFEYYIFCEDDYSPAVDHFDSLLVHMHEATFGLGNGRRHGVLAGVLQGQPAEPESRRALHLETSHIMAASSLAHLFAHTYGAVGWRGSMAERMLHLLRAAHSGKVDRYYGGGIQEGFGLLCADARVEMRDWSRVFRAPYWNHRWVIDWSGATANFTLPMAAALFVPLQLLYGHPRWVKSCCEPSEAAWMGRSRSAAPPKRKSRKSPNTMFHLSPHETRGAADDAKSEIPSKEGPGLRKMRVKLPGIAKWAPPAEPHRHDHTDST